MFILQKLLLYCRLVICTAWFPFLMGYHRLYWFAYLSAVAVWRVYIKGMCVCVCVCVWRLFIKVELLSCPSWSLKDVCNIGVKQKLQANIFLEVSVTWYYVVFVKAVWPIFGHADAVRRRVLTLVIQVHSQHSLCGIYGRQSNAGIGLSPNILILSC